MEDARLPFRRIADLDGDLLESPVWDDRRQVIFLCDIPAGRIHSVSLDGECHSWALEVPFVASLGLCESGQLVVGLQRSVALFDPATGDLRTLWDGFDEAPTSRLNDGKVGPDGAFWVGSMDGRKDSAPVSRLYRVTSDGRGEAMSDGFRSSNGLAWSADGRTLFHSDSMGPWIDAYDFDPETGALSNRRRIRDLDQATGRPDGAATDLAGHYWSAGAFAGILNRFTATGDLTGRFPLPCTAPTMPCFCGDGLRQLAVTSRRDPSYPDLPGGGVFLAEAPAPGVPVTRMAGC
ncbi:SMP-30/gluconolactonase/LRE family protein [Neotabrizicola sp. VNH66]|uniref:SMP-30/gluconolactonase/LRE family protein n=1 Tax=Neotabrizicola sp. VNH66 TaxID=3400918 RepID=UPI003BFD6855